MNTTIVIVTVLLFLKNLFCVQYSRTNISILLLEYSILWIYLPYLLSCTWWLVLRGPLGPLEEHRCWLTDLLSGVRAVRHSWFCMRSTTHGSVCGPPLMVLYAVHHSWFCMRSATHGSVCGPPLMVLYAVRHVRLSADSAAPASIFLES
jgi:hypothetical protein